MDSGIASEAFAIIDAVWLSDPCLAAAAGDCPLLVQMPVAGTS